MMSSPQHGSLSKTSSNWSIAEKIAPSNSRLGTTVPAGDAQTSQKEDDLAFLPPNSL